MKVEILNSEGQKSGEIELPVKIFSLPFNEDLVWQAVTTYLTNQRRSLAHTKTRAEVRGGGKKPWRQKGLGRARHGSIRSPIFRGGGVVFGPRKEKIYKKKINKKMKQKALFMILAEKLRRNLLKVIQEIKLSSPKTKLMKNFLNKIGWTKNVLLVLASKDKDIERASRNLPRVKVIKLEDLNPLLLCQYKYLILTLQAVEKIKERFKL